MALVSVWPCWSLFLCPTSIVLRTPIPLKGPQTRNPPNHPTIPQTSKPPTPQPSPNRSFRVARPGGSFQGLCSGPRRGEDEKLLGLQWKRGSTRNVGHRNGIACRGFVSTPSLSRKREFSRWFPFKPTQTMVYSKNKLLLLQWNRPQQGSPFSIMIFAVQPGSGLDPKAKAAVLYEPTFWASASWESPHTAQLSGTHSRHFFYILKLGMGADLGVVLLGN